MRDHVHEPAAMRHENDYYSRLGPILIMTASRAVPGERDFTAARTCGMRGRRSGQDRRQFHCMGMALPAGKGRKRAPLCPRVGPPIGQPPTAKSVPGVDQRLKTVPPVGVNVAATPLKAKLPTRTVEAKLHRERVRLFGGSAPREAVAIFSSPKAAAVMVGRDNPAHDMIPCDGGARHGDGRGYAERWRPMRPSGNAARRPACWRCDSGRYPVRCRSSRARAAGLPPGSNRCR